MGYFKVYRLPFAKSIILHGIMLALLLFSIQKQSSNVIPTEELEIVQAVVLDESKIEAELDRLRMSSWASTGSSCRSPISIKNWPFLSIVMTNGGF